MKYLTISPDGASPSGKTLKWTVATKYGVLLGRIYWLTSWRQYVFAPVADTEWSAGCLSDLVGFLESATRDQLRHARAARLGAMP